MVSYLPKSDDTSLLRDGVRCDNARRRHRREYLLNDTGAHEALRQGLLRSTRGRKPNDHNLRLLTLGLFLSIQDRGVATVQGAFRVLTEDLPLDEQLPSVCVERPTGSRGSSRSATSTTGRAHLVGLTYGEMSSPASATPSVLAATK